MSINYRLPAHYDKWILFLVLGMIMIAVTIQIAFSQTVTAQSLEALDNECRETYHEYCFGDKWSQIVEQYDNDTKQDKDLYEKGLSEDMSYLCKYEAHVNKEVSQDSNKIVCTTVMDNMIPEKNFDSLRYDLDSFDIKDIDKK